MVSRIRQDSHSSIYVLELISFFKESTIWANCRNQTLVAFYFENYI